MGLLSPLLLALGALAAVPLLLHLLQRHQGPRVVFPALRYLRRAEKESARRIRVRQLLLMLLRVAAVLLVALAAARPFVRAGGVAHAPTAAVIVLDNSMSSGVVEGDRRVLDALQERALEVLAEAGADDRFWLLRAGAPEEPALAGDAAATALRVRETAPTSGMADLPRALRHAAALLAAGAAGRAREIHLLSDLQAASLPVPVPADGTAPPIIAWHPGTAPPPNRALSNVEVSGGLNAVAGAALTVTALVEGDGTDPVGIRLSLDGQLVAAALARPGEAAVLTVPAQEPGMIWGQVEIDADALRLDDRRHFATRVLPPPAVAVIGDAPFVADALEVLANAGRLRHSGATGADVTIHAAAQGMGAASAGAMVVLPPESPVELPAANQRLAAAGVPWRFRPPVAGEARFAPAGPDPLLRSLEDARLRVVFPLDAAGTQPGDSVLLRLSDGTPWAVRGERRVRGVYVVLASPLSPQASTLPVSAAMLPLLDRIIGSWAAAQPPRTETPPGARVPLPQGSTHVHRPDGAVDDVAAATDYTLGSDPGVYRVMRNDAVIAAFTVNPATAPLDRLDRRGLEARLPGWTMHVTTSPGAWRRAVFRERLGHELWRPLLFALLVVLIVETFAATAGRRRHAATITGAGAPASPGTPTAHETTRVPEARSR
jgi:hypothetical protein